MEQEKKPSPCWIVCEDCEGQGLHTEKGYYANYTAEPNPESPLQSVRNDGHDDYSCDTCHEMIEDETMYMGDGYLVCWSCASDDGAFHCLTCKGEGEIVITETKLDGKSYKAMEEGWDCNCCGARIWDFKKTDLRVLDARLIDPDGIFFSKLCYDPNYGDGCLKDIHDQQDELRESMVDTLQLLNDIHGDDTDAIQSDIQWSPLVQDMMWGEKEL